MRYFTLSWIIWFLKMYIVFLVFSLFILTLFDWKKINFHSTDNFKKKINNNLTYFPSDFVKDIPIILKAFVNNFKNPLNFVLYLLIILFILAIRLLQLILSWFYFIYIIYVYFNNIKKEDIKFNIKIINNANFFELLKILFIKIPLSAAFIIFYKILKKIKNKEKINHNVLHLAYNFIIIQILGFHLWILNLANSIFKNIKNIKNDNLKDKIWWTRLSIKKTLLILAIRNALYENHNSYINNVNKLRLFYSNDLLHFNPMRRRVSEIHNVRGLIVNTFRSKSPHNRSVKHPAIDLEFEENVKIEYTATVIKTHTPIKNQKGLKCKEKSERDSYTIYNEIQKKDMFESYKTTPQNIFHLSDYYNSTIARAIDKDAGLNVQTKENSNYYTENQGFFHENVEKFLINENKKLITNKTHLTMPEFLHNKKSIEEIRERGYTDSEKERIELQLINIEKKGIAETYMPLFTEYAPNLYIAEKNLENQSVAISLRQEITIPDSIIDDEIKAHTTKEKEDWLIANSSPKTEW